MVYDGVMDMESMQITAKVPRELVERLDRFATEHRWSRATAIQALLEQGLPPEADSTAQ